MERDQGLPMLKCAKQRGGGERMAPLVMWQHRTKSERDKQSQVADSPEDDNAFYFTCGRREQDKTYCYK